MDCMVLLKDDHARLEQLFAGVDTGDTSVVLEMCALLESHLLVEGGVFYPAVMDEVDGAASQVATSMEELEQIRAMLQETLALRAIDDSNLTKARDLVALVREHVLDEEWDLFPVVGAVMSAERRVELGGVMESLRQGSGGGDEGASSDGDASWTEDAYLAAIVDPNVDRSVDAAMRRSQGRPPDD
jgi:hypothetical protein